MKISYVGIPTFRWKVILAGIMFSGMSFCALAEECFAARISSGNEACVSAGTREMEARDVVRRQVFSRAERYVNAGKDFRRERTETVLERLTQLGFSPEEPYLLGKMVEISSSCDSRVFSVKNETREESENGNAFLLTALESLGENGSDPNIQAAINFAQRDFYQVPEHRARVMAALPDGGRDSFYSEVLADWAGFEARVAEMLAAGEFSEKMSPDAPADIPDSEIFGQAAILSLTKNSSGVKNGSVFSAWAVKIVVPENKRCYEVRTAENTPVSGYFLVAQTNILRV